jgi:CRP-like cAMP-binding protein
MSPSAELRRNRLLALLPDDEFARLERDLETLVVPDHGVFYRPGEVVADAYFPLTSVVSMLASDQDGRAVEVATVGREGIVGVPGALLPGSASGEVIQQVTGSIARVPVARLRAEIDRRGALSSLIERYTVALMNQITQSFVCMRHHPVDSRLARWLLATQDRVGEPSFTLTQDFLALMLAQTRPQVTIAAGSLRRAGLIDYVRARITIVDRAGLEAASCECYQTIQGEFRRIFGPEDAPGG